MRRVPAELVVVRARDMRLQDLLELRAQIWMCGPEVAELEGKLAERLGARECIAVGSGTDALILSLRGLGIGPGDEVITAPNSFIATASAIVHVGATPVFADVLADQNIDPLRVEAAITSRTRAILPVHLTGRAARMPELLDLARRHGLKVIEDAAQAIDARLNGQAAGTFGDLGCFSCHPLKNLNAAGDAGFILANDAELAQRLRRARSNGLVDRETALEWGVVSRLDSLQAAVLLEQAVLVQQRATAEAGEHPHVGQAPLELFDEVRAPRARAELRVDDHVVLRVDLLGVGVVDEAVDDEGVLVAEQRQVLLAQRGSVADDPAALAAVDALDLTVLLQERARGGVRSGHLEVVAGARRGEARRAADRAPTPASRLSLRGGAEDVRAQLRGRARCALRA